MLLSYVYKLKPSAKQAEKIERWLHLLRLQYNFRVRERTEAYEQTKAPVMGNYCIIQTQGECCPLTCSVSKGALYGNPWSTKGKKRTPLAQQDANLVDLKKERPWYSEIYYHVLQQMLKQVDAAFVRFFKGLGKYPKIKRRAKFRAFTYPAGDVGFQGNKVRLPGIGWMRFFQSRRFPPGFKIRSTTVRKKADGFYISVLLQDDTVPNPPVPQQIETALGVDLGIKKLVSLSNGETIANPRFYKLMERKRSRLHRAASRQALGSHRRQKTYHRIAKLEQKVTNQREDYQWKIAHNLVKQFDLIVFENLNIQGMMARCKSKQDENGKYLPNGQSAKSKLNQAITDAAWGSLKQKVKVLSERTGVLVHEVNPKFSSQECSACGYVSPTNRDQEKFICENCAHHADADVDAAKVILKRGLDELGINLDAVSGVPRKQGKTTPKEPVATQGKSAALAVEPGNPQKLRFLSEGEIE
ncbi:transposase [Nostoc sp. CENA67]|uniref:Transposase n=1 Tax=Amazonocrinis nigriterrae CENA67 TaxID=2794033 RepID=A0A8J7HW13_9NOST|nr:RNA-guided endonuclease TnpB family protein [Amazonocrinis nigriterrae]MBH8565350.1 transposase [Amazonocrinis nigriterrae CENA67]